MGKLVSRSSSTFISNTKTKNTKTKSKNSHHCGIPTESTLHSIKRSEFEETL